MEQMSWWDKWLIGESWSDRLQHDRINQAAGEINSLMEITTFVNGNVQKLFELDREQGQELDRLRAVVNVLVKTLVEAQVIDGKALGYRIEAALADLEPEADPAADPATAGAMADPATAGAAAGAAADPATAGATAGAAAAGATAPLPAAAPVPTTACALCQREVPLTATNVTERGAVCDRCFATMPI